MGELFEAHSMQWRLPDLYAPEFVGVGDENSGGSTTIFWHWGTPKRIESDSYLAVVDLAKIVTLTDFSTETFFATIGVKVSDFIRKWGPLWTGTPMFKQRPDTLALLRELPRSMSWARCYSPAPRPTDQIALFLAGAHTDNVAKYLMAAMRCAATLEYLQTLPSRSAYELTEDSQIVSELAGNFNLFLNTPLPSPSELIINFSPELEAHHQWVRPVFRLAGESVPDSYARVREVALRGETKEESLSWLIQPDSMPAPSVTSPLLSRIVLLLTQAVQTPQMVAACGHCGGIFVLQDARKNGRGRYLCSDKCRKEAKNQQQVEIMRRRRSAARREADTS